MKTLHWKRNELNEQFSKCLNLKEMISQIEAESAKDGEVICEICVDGVRLDEVGEARCGENLRESISELSVSTNRADHLILDALVSVHSFIPDLEGSCVRTAEALRSSATGDGRRLFGESLEGCQWFIDTLGHIRGAASGIGVPVVRTERWFEAERIIVKTVREISVAYEKNDSVLVADLIEYEMTAALQLWQEVIGVERARRVA